MLLLLVTVSTLGVVAVEITNLVPGLHLIFGHLFNWFIEQPLDELLPFCAALPCSLLLSKIIISLLFSSSQPEADVAEYSDEQRRKPEYKNVPKQSKTHQIY